MIHILKGFAATQMTYTAWSFLLLVAIVYTFYYLVPTKMQWYVLLIGSSIFYYLAVGQDIIIILLFLATVVFSYIGGRILSNYKRKTVFWTFAIGSIIPLLIVKGNVFIAKRIFHNGIGNLLVPLGLSFYSLQIYACIGLLWHGR